ncbi:MAG: Ig-like domain-containing protein [Gemmatimonadota bacterium]
MPVTTPFARRFITGLCASAGLLTACDEPPALSPIRRASVAEVPQLRVTDDVVKLHEHDVAIIRLPAMASPRKVRWTSDDPTIVSVDADGKIHCLRAGSTTITVSVKNQATDVLVTVLPALEGTDHTSGPTGF